MGRVSFSIKAKEPPATVRTLRDWIEWRLAEDARMRELISLYHSLLAVCLDPLAYDDDDAINDLLDRCDRMAEESIPVRDYEAELRLKLAEVDPAC